MELVRVSNLSRMDTIRSCTAIEGTGINILDKELIDYKQYKLNQYDELAKLFEENINLTIKS